MTAPTRVEDLLALDRRALMQLLVGGSAIEPAKLEGWCYRGVSLGLPGWFDRLLWKTFRKTFYRDPKTGALRGWNVRMQQTGIDGPSEPMTKAGEPVTFGHYLVRPAAGRRMPIECPQALLLDYGAAGNSLTDPGLLMRAPIVSLDGGSADFLLGWDFVEIGPLRLKTWAFWSLQRDERIEHVAEPPRA